MNIETNTKNVSLALQNIEIIQAYIRRSNSVYFDNNRLVVRNEALVNNRDDEFVRLNSEPLNNLKFNKPQLFERNITIETLPNYDKVVVFTITLRWLEKGKYRKISIKTTLNSDRK